MEALAALGVAAAVVQFVDYSTRLISKGQQLYHSTNGALAENIEIGEASERLKGLTEPLQAVQGDEAVATICKACVVVSDELVAYLSNLKVPSGHPRRRWKSFRQAIKSVSSKDKIKELKQRLDSLRGELDTHVVLGLRKQLSTMSIQHDAQFRSLDSTTQQIMVDLLDLRRTIRTDMGNQFQHLIRSQHLEHAQTRSMFSDHARTQLEFRVSQSIIESLHYPTRTVRHETIPEAHMQTFEWIFQDPVVGGKPWSDFGNWLETGNGIYWISGKAGSGKSTLMKFVLDHEITRQKLDVWAQGSVLETPSFFFWKSGDTDQRSQEGLLRSLLHQVLLEHPEHVPTIFPDIWKRYSELASNNVPLTSSTWTLAKLKAAFAHLVAASELRVCFFIDGLDEYEGDYEELARFFSGLSCSSHIKLCLSSRPWPAFQDSFRGCASLKVQEMTQEDIHKYINDKMNDNPNMLLLSQNQPQKTESLVDDIACKAQGVFLWVTLVVKSLLKGLSHRNSLDTLRKRLNAMPPDLENLYSHMLSSIDREDLEEGSKIFQIYRLISGYHYMESVYYALREEPPPELEPSSCNTEDNTRELRRKRNDAVFQEVDILLQTRCGGLIEVHRIEAKEEPWNLGHLSYLHRTVSDFLETQGIWEKILSWTLGTNWSPKKALITSAISCLKHIICFGIDDRKESIKYVSETWEVFPEKIRAIFCEGGLSEDDLITILDDFDMHAARISLSCRWNQDINGRKSDHWSNELSYATFGWSSLTCLAAKNGLWFYVRRQLQRGASDPRQEAAPLLSYTILARFLTGTSDAEIIKTLETILSFSIDPNVCVGGASPWQCWVTILHSSFATKFTPKAYQYLARVIIVMLEAGADLAVGCIGNSDVWDDVTDWNERYDCQERCWDITGEIDGELFLDELTAHSNETWNDPNYDEEPHTHQSQCERKFFIGKRDLTFRERHCLKAIIEDIFREKAPEAADEILHLIQKLKAEKASEDSDLPVRNGKRKIEEMSESGSELGSGCIRPARLSGSSPA
ncbi:hypothetical protein VTL71DRAFT_8011 [Oculimacula yallundae]|uniref:NACHT domain-containing protein n=1 Tax=Oculimacula yallundae TaxID=86028 RepID=A0ABR4CWQ2_9HELO